MGRKEGPETDKLVADGNVAPMPAGPMEMFPDVPTAGAPPADGSRETVIGKTRCSSAASLKLGRNRCELDSIAISPRGRDAIDIRPGVTRPE
jgi:hypothetical protein